MCGEWKDGDWLAGSAFTWTWLRASMYDWMVEVDSPSEPRYVTNRVTFLGVSGDEGKPKALVKAT